MTNDGKRIAIVCGTCGSDEVSRDAWANWDVHAQDWVLGSVFDHAHCHRCECESRLVDSNWRIYIRAKLLHGSETAVG